MDLWYKTAAKYENAVKPSLAAFLTASSALDNRKLHTRGRRRRPIDLLRRHLKIPFLRVEYIRHELLRVAVDDREPGALYLYHYLMALFKYVISSMQVDSISFYLAGSYGLRFGKTVPETPAKNIVNNH